MKLVAISDRDRAILKGCAIGSVVGKSSVDDMRSLFNANNKIRVDDAPADLREASDQVGYVQLEDAELKALKQMYEDGKAGLRRDQPVLGAAIACHDHLEAATDVDAKAPAVAGVLDAAAE